MLTLGIDTSNYATSLAVVDAAARGVVYMDKRFLPVKRGQRGLRQSDALFHHTMALAEMLEKLADRVALDQVGAVGVSEKPRPREDSYMPCFLAGASFAAAFAAGRGVPLHRTSHQQGHLSAALYGAEAPHLAEAPLLLFHISGGTTDLLLTEGYAIREQLGTSLDLYAGQAVDRLGVRLGFDFPAGEALSALALECDEPVAPKISVEGMDCHLSGLENQCERLLEQGRPQAYVAKYCLAAVAETLTAMLQAARARHPGAPLLCAGGVMGSAIIRPMLQARFEDIYFAPPAYSSDNAAGVALIAAQGGAA